MVKIKLLIAHCTGAESPAHLRAPRFLSRAYCHEIALMMIESCPASKECLFQFVPINIYIYIGAPIGPITLQVDI